MPPSQTNFALLLPCDTCRPWILRIEGTNGHRKDVAQGSCLKGGIYGEWSE